MEENNILHIVKGDQYAIPFPVYLGTEPVTPDNCEGVRIQIGTILKEWPSEAEDPLTYDADRKVWCWPVTETMTRGWTLGRLPAQAGVNLGGGEWRYCPTFYIETLPNIISEVWE